MGVSSHAMLSSIPRPGRSADSTNSPAPHHGALGLKHKQFKQQLEEALLKAVLCGRGARAEFLW